jgi:hypothetical protein
MKKRMVMGALITATVLIVLVLAGLESKAIYSKTRKLGSPHTVIYLVQESLNGNLKSQRVVSRSVNEQGEWYEETLFPRNGKATAILRDGHYRINKQTGERALYKTATSSHQCTEIVDKLKSIKSTVEIAGLTAYVVGGEEDHAAGMSFERAYARETGCTPLRIKVKQDDGFEITYEALQVIFSVASNFAKDMPVTTDLRKE